MRQRMEVIEALAGNKPSVVVTSFDAFMDALVPKREIKERAVTISGEGTLDSQRGFPVLAMTGRCRWVRRGSSP